MSVNVTGQWQIASSQNLFAVYAVLVNESFGVNSTQKLWVLQLVLGANSSLVNASYAEAWASGLAAPYGFLEIYAGQFALVLLNATNFVSPTQQV